MLVVSAFLCGWGRCLIPWCLIPWCFFHCCPDLFRQPFLLQGMSKAQLLWVSRFFQHKQGLRFFCIQQILFPEEINTHLPSLLSLPKASLTKFHITSVPRRLCKSLLLSQPLVSVMNDLARQYCYPVRNDCSTGSGGIFIICSKQPLVCKRYSEFSAYP